MSLLRTPGSLSMRGDQPGGQGRSTHARNEFGSPTCGPQSRVGGHQTNVGVWPGPLTLSGDSGFVG